MPFQLCMSLLSMENALALEGLKTKTTKSKSSPVLLTSQNNCTNLLDFLQLNIIPNFPRPAVDQDSKGLNGKRWVMCLSRGHLEKSVPCNFLIRFFGQSFYDSLLQMSLIYNGK